MKYTQILYEERDEIALITFNRPEIRNCIGPTTHLELIDAWERFSKDSTLKVAILTGSGEEAFCSGGDLKAVDKLVLNDPKEIKAHNSGKRLGFLGPSRRIDIYKPIIAAVNGVAYAGGLEWACFADIRIVEEHATFGVTCRRWNIGLADGGTVRLPLIVGLGRAMEMIITGRVIDAREAKEIGLANEIVPKGQSLKRSLELAKFIGELPQPAIRTDKESVLRSYGHTLEERFTLEAQCFNKLVASSSSETRDGLRKFNERDHPDRRYDQKPKTPGLRRKQKLKNLP